MRRRILFAGAVGVVIVAPALADDLTISTHTTSPVATGTAANGTPGNIAIATGGSIAIGATGAAVTLNSSNTVSNSGTISNTFGTGAIGVNILGGNTGSFTNIGAINIPSTATPPTSTSQFGILLSGTGAFTGDIVTKPGSTLTISGSIANAVSIETELNGNLTLGGSITASGPETKGVVTSAAIDGLFSNTGSIQTMSASTSTVALNPIPGVAVGIGGSVGGGILNAGPVNSADKTAPATISTVGSEPAFIVAPSLGGDSTDLAIGVIADVNAPGNSILNRGAITASGEQTGVGATTFQVGNFPDNTSGKLTVLAGGIYNSGSIAATATSDSAKATSVAPAPANATAIILGAGAVVPGIVNDTSGIISAITSGPMGGGATALWIQAGGSLTSLTNAGTISATAETSDTSIATLTALAVEDATGTLTNVNNSGTLSATATLLTSGAQQTVAADMSAATSVITFNNTGTVRGDLRFGGASGNQLTIEGANAIVSGRVQAAANGSVNIVVSGGGTGGTLQTSHVIGAGTLTVGPGGTVDFQVGPETAIVTTTGAASFDAASHITITPISLLATSTSIRLVHSDTSLSFGNLAATTASANIPFMFTGGLSADGQNLTLDLQRKTATQLGLTGNAAAIYEPAAAAALGDSELGAVLGSLASNEAVQSTLDELLPLRGVETQAIVDVVSDPASDPIGIRQRRLMLDSTADAAFSPWMDGFYVNLNRSGPTGYTGHGGGGTFGVDFNQGGKGHFGAAFTLYDANVREKAATTTTTDVQWYLFSPYLGFRFGDVFLNAQFNAGAANVSGARTVNVGSITRIADSDGIEILASGGITGGYVLDLGFLQLIPQVSITGMDLVDNNYTEQGGGPGVDLNVGARNRNTARGFVGLEAAGDYEYGGARLVPQLLAGWNHELVSSSGDINAAFASVPNSTFTVSGPSSDRSQFVGTASLDYVAKNWAVALDFSGLTSSHASSESAGISFSSRF